MDLLWLVGLVGVGGVALFLRFDGLAEPSLWYDEVLHVNRAREAMSGATSWWGWFTGLPVDRENGPLYYALQVLSLHFAEGEFGVRLAPAIAGLFGVLGLGLAATATTRNRWIGLAAALLIAVSPLHVYYSREGRPYSAVMLGAAVLILLALLAERRWARIFVFPACLAIVYCGAIGAPLLIAFLLLAICDWYWSRFQGGLVGRGSLVLAAGLALCVLPMLFPTVQGIDRVSGDSTERREHSAGLEITRPLSPEALDRLAASFTVSGLDSGTTNYVSWIALLFAVSGAGFLLRTQPRAALWLLGLWLLPVCGWLAALHRFDHWYNVRYTSSGLPAFLILVAVGACQAGPWAASWVRRRQVRGEPTPLPPAWVSTVFSLAVLGLLLVPGWTAARKEPWNKPPWREVADLVGTWTGPDEVVVTREEWSFDCLGYYLDELGHEVELVATNFSEASARSALQSHRGGFFLSAGYHHAPWLDEWTATLHPVLRRERANLRLYYWPDFATLVSPRSTQSPLAPMLAQLGYVPGVQDFSEDASWLGPGWSVAEREPEGRTFRWAADSRAELALVATGPNPTRHLRLWLRPFPTDHRPPQRLHLSVHGQPVGSVTLEPGWNQLTLGPYRSDEEIDHLEFTFDWVQSPRDLDPAAEDERTLAVAFDRVLLVEGEPPRPDAP